MKAHLCTECGELHVISLAHKETLNKMKYVMLRTAAEYVKKTMVNDFMVRDIAEPEQFKLFNNFQKLRYHGLVTPARDSNKKRIKGRWIITRNGWAFLHGRLSLSKSVLVRDNSIVDRSVDLVTLRNISQGDVEIQTNFEYFDEDNRPVGWMPTISQETLQQLSLV